MATTVITTTDTPAATTAAGFHIPWSQIDEGLTKMEEAAGSIERFGPIAASLIGSFMPQLKPFLAESDELLPRIREVQLLSQVEQAAEGLHGDARWNAMCDAAAAWAKRNRPAAKPFVNDNIPPRAGE